MDAPTKTSFPSPSAISLPLLRSNGIQTSELSAGYSIEIGEISSPPRSETNLVDLPLELTKEIVNYLHFNDFGACSLVSKKWGILFRDDFLLTTTLKNHGDVLTNVEMKAYLGREISKYKWLQHWLLDLVLKSRTDKEVRSLAAIAITLLGAAKLNFARMDLKGIHISGANLDNACMFETDFEGADLRNVSFHGTLLSAANLKRCKLEGVKLSQSEMMKIFKYFDDHWIPSANGRYVAISRIIGWSVWDRQNEKQICCRYSHNIGDVAFSKCGNFLATSSGKSTLQILELPSGECRHAFTLPTACIEELAFSSDRRFVAGWCFNPSSRNDKRMFQIWDLETEKCLDTFLPQHSDTFAFRFNPDSKFLATLYRHNDILQIWHLESGECRQTFSANKDGKIEFSPDGRFVANVSSSWLYNDTLQVWNLENGECRLTYSGPHPVVTAFAFSSEGRFVAMGSRGKSTSFLQILDVEKDLKTEPFQLEILNIGRIRSMRFINNDRELVFNASGEWRLKFKADTLELGRASISSWYLFCDKINIKGAIGLSEENRKLLQEHEAIEYLPCKKKKIFSGV